MISTKINVDVSEMLKSFETLEKEGKLTTDGINKLFQNAVKVEVDDKELTTIPKTAKDSFDKVEKEATGMFSKLKGALDFGSIFNFAIGDLVADGIGKIGEGIGFLAEEASKADAIGTALENGFRLAGLSGEQLDEQLQKTTKFAREFGFAMGVAPERIKELSATAGSLGGATGKMNEDLTKLAIGIENATGGAIKGENAIKIFSRGISDPENAEAIDKLKKSFPQLGDALLTANSPAEKIDATLQALSGTFTTMKNDTTDVEARLGIFKSQVAEGAQAIGGAFLGSFNTDKLLEFFGEMGNGVDIFGTLENAGNFLGETLTSVLNTIIDVVKQVTSSPIFQFLKNNIELVSIALVTYIGYTKALVYEQTIMETKTKALAIAQGLYNGIIAFGNGVLTTAKAVMTAYSNGTVLATAKTYLMNTAQTLLNVVMSANPIGLVVVALGALTAGLVYAYKNSETFRKIIDSIWETMKGWLNTLGFVVKKVLEFLGIIGKDTKIEKKVELKAEIDTTSFNNLNKQINELIAKNDGSGQLKLKQFEDSENAIKRNIEEQKKLGKITDEQYQQLIKNLDAIDYKKKEKEKKEKKEKEHVETLNDLYKKLYDETEKLALKQDFGAVYQNNILKLKELQKEIEKEKTAKLILDYELKEKEIEDFVIRPKKITIKELPKIEMPKDTKVETTELEKALSNNLVDIFSKLDYSKYYKTKENEQKENLDVESANLLTSLQRNEIAYEEYAERLNEIDRNRRDSQIESNSAIIQALNDTISISFANAGDIVSKSLMDNIKLTEDFGSSISANWDLMALNVGLSAGKMVAEGKNAFKAIGTAAFDMLQSLVPIWSAQILGYSLATPQSIASLNAIGLAQWAGLTALIQGAVVAARSALKLKDGMININGAGTSKSDSIPAMLSKGESVINARSTQINEPFLRYANNGGDLNKLFAVSMNTRNLENLIAENNMILQNKNLVSNVNVNNRFEVANSGINVKFKR